MKSGSAGATSKVLVRKPYTKPTLVRGPTLTEVTAVPAGISGTSTMTGCWVARAAFGERDIRWMIFRAWLFEDAPVWFRELYLRHGARVGGWLESRDGARRLVRIAMMPAVRRKLMG